MATRSPSGYIKLSLKAAELLTVCLGFSAMVYKINTWGK